VRWITKFSPKKRGSWWKLVASAARTELFNLAADAGEMIDLAAQQPALVAELRGALAAWERDVGPQKQLLKGAK